MVFSQAVDVMFQRVERRRRDDAALPHAAAEEFADAARSSDEIACAGKGRADGRSESLAEPDRHGIELRRPRLRRNPRRDDGVPQTSAVEMEYQAIGVRPGADRLNLLERIDAAA